MRIFVDVVLGLFSHAVSIVLWAISEPYRFVTQRHDTESAQP